MSLNFSRLWLPEMVHRRDSIRATEHNEDESDSEYTSEETDHRSIDDHSSFDYKTVLTYPLNPQMHDLPQKARLLSVLRGLRNAVDEQTQLYAQLKHYGVFNKPDHHAHKWSKMEQFTAVKSEIHSPPQSRTADKEPLLETEEHGVADRERLPKFATDFSVVRTEINRMKCCERLSKRTEQMVVEIRVVFLKIGEIDTLKEIYHADAFIQAKWREPQYNGKSEDELRKLDLPRCWNPLIIIDNILSESKEQHWMIAQKDEKDEVYIVERRRLRGIFLETLELNDFPLDVQDLTITLTSERPDSELILIPDRIEACGINLHTLVDQQEWKLHEHIEVTRRSAAQEYTNSSQFHPCISVTCRAARRPGYFYWNVFLIMFFITGLSFATFAVPYDRPENRLQLSFTLFLTSVAFKFVINQSLPKISYLTYMDKYVLLSLAILCVVSIWHAVVTLLPMDIGYAPNGMNARSKLSNEKYMELISLSNYTIPNTIWTGMNTTNITMDTNSFINQFTTDIRNTNMRKWDFSQWKQFAKQKLQDQREIRKLKMRIEKDVLISFGLLYILAHLTFIYWLYFDASKRRREMIERDRQYKLYQASQNT